MIANLLGTDGLIVLIIALVVLFGGSQLPKLARNVGAAGKEFRKAQADADHEAAQAQARGAEAQSGQAAQAELAAAPPPATPAAASRDDDKLVISRNDLREELANLLDERRDPGN